jgi:1,4-alpha-glucan branching enzyme
MENLSKSPRLIEMDPWLEQAEGEILARHSRFVSKLNFIEQISGNIGQFANAYEYMGFHFIPNENCWVYREWAPGAHGLFLTGDFNNWNQYAHPLERKDHGIWEIKLNAAYYEQVFTHGSKVKVLVKSAIGDQLRIPAYINRVVQDEDTKNFSGQLWFPPAFNWENDSFEMHSLGDLFIYEAHVGMAQEKEGLGTYNEFTEKILPRIKKAGYNAVQLMAIQEHPYYGSFGYHVSSFFAPSSRFGTPEDLKNLISTAHGMGIAVIMDLVHSHTVKNLHEGLNLFDGTETQYFHAGARGEHPDWDSKLFDYGKTEVIQFLLSNIKYWLKEFHFDGFRFDGVGSMLYFHHGNETIDSIDKYFTQGVEFDAITYLQLANHLTHLINPQAITIAEDVSGMPGLTSPIDDGGIGFDFRLGMGIPDFWIKYLKDVPDEEWSMAEMWHVLNDRLPYVKTVTYCESHDQALVGDKTIAFRLMDKEMYFNMQSSDENIVVERGIALHKMIRLMTISLGGQAYLNFMGNEFGHPEWIDFPREGNNWSYLHARRQWSLMDNPLLRYHYLSDFDRAMIKTIKEAQLLGTLYANQINCDETNKCIIYERAGLIFLFNFHSNGSIPGYQFHVQEAGQYKIVLNSDSASFGGQGRINEEMLYTTSEQEETGAQMLSIYFTCRTAIVLKKVGQKQ